MDVFYIMGLYLKIVLVVDYGLLILLVVKNMI